MEEIRPNADFGSAGFDDPVTALAAAGGVPRSDESTPLVVVVNDPDRATDSASALRAIRADAGNREIHVVVATGSHVWGDDVRREFERPLADATGPPSRFAWHHPFDDHVAVGPARLARTVAEAKDLVGVGSVEPHWFAGLTGAHKTLTVGVMHRDDIAASHFHAMSDDARPFRLAGNPVHEGFVQVLTALSIGRSIVSLQHVGPRWFGGRPLACLDQAAPVAQRRWSRQTAKPFDFLVAVVEPPLSRSLYQAEKGVKNNEYAVRDGGAILLDAACEDGVGPDRFIRMLETAPDVAAAHREIASNGYRLGDHKAVRLRALQARGVRIGVVSPTFPKALGASVGIDVYGSRTDATASLRREFDANSRGAVVEDAGQMVVST